MTVVWQRRVAAVAMMVWGIAAARAFASAPASAVASASASAPQAAGRSSQAIVPPGPAYLLLELPSRRVIAESRRDVLDTAVAPGSVIKIATLIAAVEQGVVDDATRIACRRRITVDGHVLTCVHPDLHRPLSPVEALGYSCNTFFASVAQRLSRGALDAVLVRMGLEPSTPAAPTVLAALGLAGVRATPRALLNAFLKVAGPAPTLHLSDATRAMVTAGLRTAATSGTASALGDAGIRALAKTGTAPMRGGGYLGMLVAATIESTPGYAIVVSVAGGAGSDAAAVAADLMTRTTASSRGPARDDRPVRVGVAKRGGGYDVVVIPFESYVARVVAGEMPATAPPQALEAMAITVRTFTAANRARHANEGFDLCDLTHCQAMGKASGVAEAAAQATRNLVLRDGDRVASIFYSAWCGGHTEMASHVWAGAADPAYLSARPDPACRNEPAWTSEIAAPQLHRVLEAAGLRGSDVRNFAVASRHPSGRAATLRVDGMVPESLDATTFQRAAGVTLGWQVVKSTLFDVRRSAQGYVISGRGLGHGVGLCVRGATSRAAAGRSRDEILAAYFPGLRTAALTRATGAGATTAQSGRGGSARSVRVVLPEGDGDRLDAARTIVERAAVAMTVRLGVPMPPDVVVRFYPTVEAYVRATRQPWWTAARTTGTHVEVLPFDVLRKRGTLELTLRHELVHVLADRFLGGRPLWVREGVATVMAGEWAPGPDLDAGAPGAVARNEGRRAACPSDADFAGAASPEAWRRVYEAAGSCVSHAMAAGAPWRDLR
ncbi:MAG: SpoIID/LytB domain-containing protein [Acidobacteriota bacterium]